jgi:hypothetical protein
MVMFTRYDETPILKSNSVMNVDLRLVGDFSKSMEIPDMPKFDGSSQFENPRWAFANRTIASIFDAVQEANQAIPKDQQCRIYGYRFSTEATAMGLLNQFTKSSVYGEAVEGVTNLQSAIELVLKDGNDAIAENQSRKQVIIVLTDGTPTNSQGKSNEDVMTALLETFYKQSKKQKTDEELTIGFIQCTSNASKFREYCISGDMWNENGDTGGIYHDILKATEFLKIADDKLSEFYPDIPFDIIDCISADEMLDEFGNLKPIADLIAKMIAD